MSLCRWRVVCPFGWAMMLTLVVGRDLGNPYRVGLRAAGCGCHGASVPCDRRVSERVAKGGSGGANVTEQRGE